MTYSYKSGSATDTSGSSFVCETIVSLSREFQRWEVIFQRGGDLTSVRKISFFIQLEIKVFFLIFFPSFGSSEMTVGQQEGLTFFILVVKRFGNAGAL